MKQKILLFLAACLISLAASAQSDFYKYHENVPGYETVYISKAMLNIGLGAVGDNMNISSLKGKLTGMEIITTEQLMKQLNDEYFSYINSKKDAELLMSTSEGDESVNIYLVRDGKKCTYYMFSREPKEASVIIFYGTMTPEDILELTK